MPCPDHTRLDPFCDDCRDVEGAEFVPVAFTPIEPLRACCHCRDAGPSAGPQADGLCERCEQGQKPSRGGLARLQAWLERQA